MSRSGGNGKCAGKRHTPTLPLRLVARSYFAVLVALFLRSISSPYCSPSTLSLASFALSLVLRLLGRLLSVSYCSLSFALSLDPSPPRSWSSWRSFPSDYPCDLAKAKSHGWQVDV